MESDADPRVIQDFSNAGPMSKPQPPAPTGRIILDDCPRPDFHVAPLPLLYRPLGEFLDICDNKTQTFSTSFDMDVDYIRPMMQAVDLLVATTSEFHNDDGTRRNKIAQGLDQIFACYRSYEDRPPPIRVGTDRSHFDNDGLQFEVIIYRTCYCTIARKLATEVLVAFGGFEVSPIYY
ncbi:hypothetical protein PM082_011969 [Marasmius tenuissimus]|nr:hypothetical protein PM082_011969 [Marasmius tenuissimus]